MVDGIAHTPPRVTRERPASPPAARDLLPDKPVFYNYENGTIITGKKRGEGMGFFDKIKEQASSLGAQLDSAIDSSKQKSQVNAMRKQRGDMISQLGDGLLEQFRQGQVDAEGLRPQVDQIFDLERQIIAAEQEMEAQKQAAAAPPAAPAPPQAEAPPAPPSAPAQPAPAAAAGVQTCPSCGSEVPGDSAFCPNCGARVTG